MPLPQGFRLYFGVYTTSPQISVWKLLLATGSTFLFSLKGFITKKKKFYSPSSCSKPVFITFFCWTKELLVAIDFYSIFSHTMDINSYQQLFGYANSWKYLLLCSTEERNSHRFGKTWGWLNHDASISSNDGEETFYKNVCISVCTTYILDTIYILGWIHTIYTVYTLYYTYTYYLYSLSLSLWIVYNKCLMYIILYLNAYFYKFQYTTVSKFGARKTLKMFFERSLLCSARLCLFDQKYSKNSNIAKYY